MKFLKLISFITFILLIVLVQSNHVGRENAENSAIKKPSESECKPYIVKAIKELGEKSDSIADENSHNDLIANSDANEDVQIESVDDDGEDQNSETNIETQTKNDKVVAKRDVGNAKVGENDNKDNNVNVENKDETVDQKSNFPGVKNAAEVAKKSPESNENVRKIETTMTSKDGDLRDVNQKEDGGGGDDDDGATEQSGNGENEEVEDETEEFDDEEALNRIGLNQMRSREHINRILDLNEISDKSQIENDMKIDKFGKIILRDLKKLYDNSIKPLEQMYKYRDLSNRHFGDAEIFSKPLIVFMGPWSGGKSTIINYLLNAEYEVSLKTGAEPSPTFFHILMNHNETEILDGAQLVTDTVFSGLQKFGHTLEDKLKGHKFPNRLLEKMNIVEIPGILEVNKHVSRQFAFNDVCQWFIDRADLIYLVYDPMKIDVGPEIAAIMDQLKGRETSLRIIFNKADRLTHDEVIKMQNALIWNISPVLSALQPPTIYTTSLWPFAFQNAELESFLDEQEAELLKDLKTTIDKRIETKITNARRFAIRVRNHAKMVDCYLTTYYNHKTMFGNKKFISDAIIENPQNYHIYEGLTTLTNISRYDLPDPDMYRNFFRLNPLFEFRKLSETCTYFKGCPINKLDIAIAYDLPELINKYKKRIQTLRQPTAKN